MVAAIDSTMTGTLSTLDRGSRAEAGLRARRNVGRLVHAWRHAGGSRCKHKDISFLRHRRVKPNAMPADVFVRFLERKLAEHGIGKVVPDNNVLEQHTRHILTRALTNKALGAIRARDDEDAASIPLPSDLHRELLPLSQASVGHSLGACVR
jgi:hypothetical protein